MIYIHVIPEALHTGEPAICVHYNSGKDVLRTKQYELDRYSRLVQSDVPVQLGPNCAPHVFIEEP